MRSAASLSYQHCIYLYLIVSLIVYFVREDEKSTHLIIRYYVAAAATETAVDTSIVPYTSVIRTKQTSLFMDMCAYLKPALHMLLAVTSILFTSSSKRRSSALPFAAACWRYLPPT